MCAEMFFIYVWNIYAHPHKTCEENLFGSASNMCGKYMRIRIQYVRKIYAD